MNAKSVLMRPQSLRPRRVSPLAPLAMPLLLNRPTYNQSWEFAHTVRIKAYFFRVAQFALRIYKAICVFAICALKK